MWGRRRAAVYLCESGRGETRSEEKAGGWSVIGVQGIDDPGTEARWHFFEFSGLTRNAEVVTSLTQFSKIQPNGIFA
jgi:hypothetical protein